MPAARMFYNLFFLKGFAGRKNGSILYEWKIKDMQ
jgi:hypothetical protein